MSDLALFWDTERFAADVVVGPVDLATDEGLEAAIIASLFTDARARDDDPLPDDAGRRGWWGDSLEAVGEPRLGSRLWLLGREKQLPKVVERARAYVQEALAWLVADGVAASVETTAEIVRTGVLGIGVVVTRPGAASRRFDFVWKALS